MYLVFVIALVILLYTMQSLFTRFYTDNYPGDQSLTTPVFAVVCGFIVTVVSFIFSGFSFKCGWITVLLGVINAVVLYAYDAFIIKASATGPYSLLMTFSLTGGIVVPAIVSWISNPAGFSFVQLAAILIIFASVLMITTKKEDGESKDEHKKHRTFFLIICTLLGLANGLYGVLLNLQQEITGVSEKEEMVAVTFIGAAVISLVQLLIKEKKNTLKAFRQTKLSLTFLLLSAGVSALAINALVIALEGVNETVVYTFDNAGVLLLSAIASAVFFKEKLSKLNIAGCLLVSVGLAFMGGYEFIESFIAGLFA
jgi:drug/metabolite transporter (DMT)-like permease